MGDREAIAKTNGGIECVEVAGVPNPLLEVALQRSNLTTLTPLGQDTDELVLFDASDTFNAYRVSILDLRTYLGIPTGMIIPFSVSFPGTMTAVTATANEAAQQRKIIGISGSTNKLIGLGISGVSGKYGSSGNTVIIASDTAHGSGTEVSVSLAWNLSTVDLASVSLTLGGSAELFIYISNVVIPAGHEGLQVYGQIQVS